MSAPCGREGGRADPGAGPGREASPRPPAQLAARLSSLSNLSAWSPRPSLATRQPGRGSACPGKPVTARGLGCRERVQSKLCQRRPERSSQGPAGPGGGALCPEGSLQPFPQDPRPFPGRPQPHLAPAADRLERTGSPPARGSAAARTHAHARHRARGPHSGARPLPRALPPSLAHGGPDAPGSGAGARDAGALFPGCLISRRAPGAQGPGAGPTGQAPPLPAPPGRQVGAVESQPHPSKLPSLTLFYSLYPSK